MHGPLYQFLANDHTRLDGLLQRATADPGEVEQAAYAEFRAGLLKHIGMEEKILLPAAQHARGGEPLPVAARLRLDHGALAALLVPTPTVSIIAALRAILAVHNEVEGGPEGVYETCEPLAGPEAETLLVRLRTTPEVPVASHVNGPAIMNATRRALARAGYNLEDYEAAASD